MEDPFVFIFYCCYDKLPQFKWPKAMQIYYLRVLQVRSLTQSHLAKIKVWVGLCSYLETRARSCFLAFPCLSGLFLHLESWQQQAESFSTLLCLGFSPLSTFLSLTSAGKNSLLLRICVIILGPPR